MSVKPNETCLYGSANMPDADGATTGGAVSFSKKISFADMAAAGLLDYVSSSASDTAVVLTITGRDATGVVQTEAKTLNGTTPVAGTQSFERLLKGVASGTTAVGDVAAISHTAAISAHTMQVGAANGTGVTPPLAKLAAADGAASAVNQIIRITSGTGNGQIRQIIDNTSYGTDFVAVNRDWSVVPDATSVYSIYNGMLFDLAPSQITEVRRPFYAAQADVAGGASRTFYEKVFFVNTNTATALTAAQILKQVDPGSGVLEFALTNALNDTATVANRQTAPVTGVTAFTTGNAPQAINVPSPQNLPRNSTAHPLSTPSPTQSGRIFNHGP